MSLVSRGTRAATKPLRRATQIRNPPSRIPRRNASHDAPFEYDASESAMHTTSGATGSEGLGKGAYITLTFIPLCYITYSLAKGDPDNIVNKYVESFLGDEGDKSRNAVHSAMLQQALQDRALFKTSPTDRKGPDLRFPELLNTGSPWNVIAGEGTADMSELIAFRTKQVQDLEEERAARSKGGKILTVYDELHKDKEPEVTNKTHNKATV